MNRRDFAKISVPLGLTPIFINGIPLRSFASSNMVQQLCEEINERVLVIIHLNGGNDGLNNLIPVDQYDDYAKARANIKIAQNALSQWDSTLAVKDQIYYHPNLQEMKGLYDDGKLNIIQGVGYPSSNKSHFKSRDLWMEGRDGSNPDGGSDGWIARYLQNRFPNYVGKPFGSQVDPLGLILGRAVKTGFHSFEEHAVEINLSGQDPEGYFSQVASVSGVPITNLPDSDYGIMLKHIMNVENSLNLYAGRITEVFNKGKNSSVQYPERNRLGDQLKTVARLLAGGSMTKVFMCSYSGFDTHANQVTSGDPLKGKHSELLEGMSTSMKAFQDDLANLGQENRVMTVMFSEFGRKIIQNGNYGSDHGTLGPVYVFGKGVQGGVIGTNIDLNNRDKQGAPNNNQLQYDYRQIFGTVLQDWLGASDDSIKAVNFDEQLSQKLNLVDKNFKVEPSCYINAPVPVAKIRLSLLLEGFYDEGAGNMRTTLREKGIIPAKQPFTEAPFNYEGTEEITHSETDVVDWVYLEVREVEQPDKVLSQKAAIVDSKGIIRDDQHSDQLSFSNISSGEYLIAVYHKSHLAVMSADPVNFTLGEPPLYDFTEAVGRAMGNDQLKNVNDSGRFAMRVGDFDQNGLVNNLDFNAWSQKAASIDDYLAVDADGNGIVNNLDFNSWKKSISKIGIPDLKK